MPQAVPPKGYSQSLLSSLTATSGIAPHHYQTLTNSTSNSICLNAAQMLNQ